MTHTKKEHGKEQSVFRSKLFISVFAVGFTILVLTAVDQLSAQLIIPNKFQDFITLSLSIFVEAFPFLVLGSVLAAAVNTYVPVHTFEKWLPKRGLFRRATLSMLGFLFPVC